MVVHHRPFAFRIVGFDLVDQVVFFRELIQQGIGGAPLLVSIRRRVGRFRGIAWVEGGSWRFEQ